MTWIVIVPLVVALVLVIVAVMVYGMKEIERLMVYEVDLVKVPDGVYRGSFHRGRCTYDVKVEVEDRRIVAIENVSSRVWVAKEFDERAVTRRMERLNAPPRNVGASRR